MKMAAKQASLILEDDDYIEMELSSPSNFFSYSIGSPPQTREFEFQKMTSVSNEKESTTSPADELFYKGKLLPLHLPPRLQMVQKLLENSTAKLDYVKSVSALENSSFPFIDLTLPSTSTTTPLESCNISPSESRRVSSELNPDEYLFNWPTDIKSFESEIPRKSWSKKLKQIKLYWLGQRLKSSLKSWFSKSGCTDKSCASAANNVAAEENSKCKHCRNKYLKASRRHPFGIINDNKSINRDILEDGLHNARRSFSGAIQRRPATKSSSLSTSSSGSSSSSASFCYSSSGFYDLQLFKRSSSANVELEGSIEGAIAHCKQSQRQCRLEKILDEASVCSQSSSKNAVCENPEAASQQPSLSESEF